ncbi:S1/P1 nuclease [Agarivorans sp.]|uniref:S1/P1 nuclease n=1 Tax=Agarivorans sp. TaxID=1872412 RepID=UPI003D02A0B9
MRSALLFYLCFFSLPSMAFGVLGHQLVAYIAEQQLSASTKQQINTLLGQQSLVDIATWADQVRKDPAWQYTAPWHYINLAKGQNLSFAKRNPKGDVLSQLYYFEGQLANHSLSHKVRSQALKFYVHLLADLHQPLHVAYAEDRGGNQHEVTWYGKPSNLHRVWDSQLLDTAAKPLPSYALQLMRDYPLNQQQLGHDYHQWFLQTRQLVPMAYHYSSKQLGDVYLQDKRPLIEQQLALAAYRLASKLNQLLD